MIPKTIHYCWFGGNPLPKSAIKCIESWRKFMPDYEIKQWDESNFDVSGIPYIVQAYEQKKYAFVSDYARFKILYDEGGIYFDTDVELIRPIDDIIKAGNFMGIEKTQHIEITNNACVNPGLGLGSEPKLNLIAEILSFYESLPGFDIHQGTIVTYTTDILRRHGFNQKNEMQTIAGVNIYPADVFCPMDSTTGILTVTPETRSIHHYSCSWIDHNTFKFRLHLLKNTLIKIFGVKLIRNIVNLIKT